MQISASRGSIVGFSHPVALNIGGSQFYLLDNLLNFNAYAQVTTLLSVNQPFIEYQTRGAPHVNHFSWKLNKLGLSSFLIPSTFTPTSSTRSPLPLTLVFALAVAALSSTVTNFQILSPYSHLLSFLSVNPEHVKFPFACGIPELDAQNIMIDVNGILLDENGEVRGHLPILSHCTQNVTQRHSTQSRSGKPPMDRECPRRAAGAHVARGVVYIQKPPNPEDCSAWPSRL